MKIKQITSLFFFISISLFIGCGDSGSDDQFENNPVLSFNEIQQINSSNGATYSGTSENSSFVAQLGDRPIPTPNANPTPTVPGGFITPDDNQGFASRTLNFIDGADGNLWKPVSESNGNIVVLFNPSFRRTFSGGCTIQKRDGSFSPLYCGGVFSCFTNPNRLTMRSNVKCSDAREVKVTCNDANQVVVFTVPVAQRGQVCDRHD